MRNEEGGGGGEVDGGEIMGFKGGYVKVVKEEKKSESVGEALGRREGCGRC